MLRVKPYLDWTRLSGGHTGIKLSTRGILTAIKWPQEQRVSSGLYCMWTQMFYIMCSYDPFPFLRNGRTGTSSAEESLPLVSVREKPKVPATIREVFNVRWRVTHWYAHFKTKYSKQLQSEIFSSNVRWNPYRKSQTCIRTKWPDERL